MTAHLTEDALRAKLGWPPANPDIRGDEPSDGPGESTLGPRDPDGLLAENARERQWRWFE